MIMERKRAKVSSQQGGGVGRATSRSMQRAARMKSFPFALRLCASASTGGWAGLV